MLEKQLSPNTINRMLAAVRHMLMEAEEKKLIPTGDVRAHLRQRAAHLGDLRNHAQQDPPAGSRLRC